MNTNLILLYSLIFFVIYIIGKSVYFYKKEKINPAAFLATGNQKEKILWSSLSILLLLFGILIILNALNANIGGQILQENEIMSILGVLSLLAGVFVMALAQYQMGTDWRMGNDEKGNIHLVKKGIFKRSRNPIYLSIMLLSLGVVILLNNVI